MEEFSNGTAYWHSGACKCQTCRQIYDAHNTGNMGTFLKCSCSGCVSRRDNPQQWTFIQESPRIERVRKTSMATINMCEREGCNAMFQSNVGVNLALQQFVDGELLFRGEICPGCVGDLMQLLTNAPETERLKAYSKPWEPSVSEGAPEGVRTLSDEELASELVRRQGLTIAHQITDGADDL